MNGVDRAAERKLDKVMKDERAANTFEAVAREWFVMHSPRWAESHSGKLIRRLEMYVFSWLGHKPIAELKPLELLTVLRRIESKGVSETAHRALQVCGRVMRYAVTTGRVERDFTRDLAGALAPVRERHLASITDPAGVGVLLRMTTAVRSSPSARSDWRRWCSFALVNFGWPSSRSSTLRSRNGVSPQRA